MIKAFLSSFIVFIVGLLFVEFTLRFINSDMNNYDIEMWKYARELKISDPVLGHVHKSNSQAILQKVQIKLNSKGMRSEEILIEKQKVLFLGASFTLGWGVKYNEAYPTRIGSYLKRKEADFQVLNSSTGNYNAFRYITNFLKNQRDLKPKYLVINYFINDAEILPEVRSNFLLNNSQLVAALLLTVKKLSSAKDKSLIEYYNELYQPTSPGYLRMKQAMKEVAEYAKLNNTKVYFIMIPEMHFLRDYPFLPIHSRMKEITQEFGFIYHDLYTLLEGLDIKNIRVMEGDSHPNARIHAMVAEDLINTIFSKLE